MARSNIPTQSLYTPIVACVGASPAFNARCREAGSRAGAFVLAVDLPSVLAVTARRRPVALVLTEAIYELDPATFSALARRYGAWLLIVEDEHVSQDELEGRLRAAVSEPEWRAHG